MKNFAKLGSVVVLTMVASGCAAFAQGGDSLVTGFVYSGYKTGGQVGTGSAATKTGEACASTIFGLIATGDSSITAAKQNGGIKEVTHVDHDVFSVLGIYATACTVVSGN